MLIFHLYLRKIYLINNLYFLDFLISNCIIFIISMCLIDLLKWSDLNFYCK